MRKFSRHNRQTENRFILPPQASRPTPARSLQQLYRTLGNRTLGRVILTKRKVSQPGDSLELEADRVADQVMATAAEVKKPKR